MTDLTGTRLGDFEIVREVGRGGMGVVYEARQVSLNRRVALKVLGPGLGLTPRAVDRFRREAEAAARLHHTNIVPVYATGEQQGTHFYAMELIDGSSLDHVIRQLRTPTEQSTDAVPEDLATTNVYTPPDPLGSSPPGSAPGSSAARFDRMACGERPEWVAPRAFLAVVCNDNEDWVGEVEHGTAALKLTPASTEDFLFRGYLIGFDNPRRGLPDVDAVWSRRRSVLVQFIRAEVLSSLADESGRVEDAVVARGALRGARDYLGDSPAVTMNSLLLHCIGCNNCRLQAIRERILEDPTWPPWLAETK